MMNQHMTLSEPQESIKTVALTLLDRLLTAMARAMYPQLMVVDAQTEAIDPEQPEADTVSVDEALWHSLYVFDLYWYF